MRSSRVLSRYSCSWYQFAMDAICAEHARRLRKITPAVIPADVCYRKLLKSVVALWVPAAPGTN